MPVRDIVHIDQDLCDGCGQCITACAEGAIQLVDGTARLLGDSYCDGLGACLGHCPQGAITIIRRTATDYDKEAVALHLAAGHRQAGPVLPSLPLAGHAGGACPGSRVEQFSRPPVPAASRPGDAPTPSALGQWPVQLHLLPPVAPFLQGAHLLLAADCSAYAFGGFHERLLAGRALAIACPKLDSHQEVYLEKLTAMIDHAALESITVVVMEVPCCNGLVRLAEQAAAAAVRAIPIHVQVVGVRGDVLLEEGVSAC